MDCDVVVVVVTFDVVVRMLMLMMCLNSIVQVADPPETRDAEEIDGAA